jgi:hypothetical protein
MSGRPRFVQDEPLEIGRWLRLLWKTSELCRQPGGSDLSQLGGIMAIDRHDRRPADVNEVLNPHRGEEQSRAREHAADILARRGVLLSGDETDDELAELWSAVDRFESVVEARGGDTMTNAPDSAEPDNPAFVLPERKARESARDYTQRILEAAAGLTSFER